MIATLNNASFDKYFESFSDADCGFRKLLATTLQLCEGYITNKVEYKGAKINLNCQVAKDVTIYDVLNSWQSDGNKGKENFRFMITLLSKIQSCKVSPNPGKEIAIKGVKFTVPEDDTDSILISLSSNDAFRVLMLKGILSDGKELQLPNIAEVDHIYEHRKLLGIRRYEPNPKHKKVSSAYGKGKVASPMTLDNDEAQKLLNKAIFVDGRLCAAKDNVCYMFMNHVDVYFHGYIEENPSDKVKSMLGLK